MEKQDAIAFIAAVNAAQPYVPPIIFGTIINSAVAKLAIAVANDQAVCELANPMTRPQVRTNGQDLPANE